MKRNNRRLQLSRTTITQLDAQRLAAANGGVWITGCVGGCNSWGAQDAGCNSDSCLWCVPQPDES